jgi:hypothetical protein
MRVDTTNSLGILSRGLLATGLIALVAGSASAQLIYDGNLFFNNNATGTLAGQFSGAPNAGTPGCAPGLSAAVLGTVTYPNNIYADPLLPDAPYKTNVVPNFQPALGSPAYGSAVTLPNDGFFKQVCYRGAIGPNPGDDWTKGWTIWDSTGANRQDLHLAGMPNPRPLANYNNISFTSAAFWSPDSNYLVRGQLRVKNGAVLTIAPGVVVFEDVATLGTMIIERGGKLYAIGNACEPIIITSSATPGTQIQGDCGGLTFLGRAKTNVVNSCAGDSSASEGGAIGYFGGNDDNDCSGVIRYLRVEFAGKEITPNNELNSITFNACGHNTHGDYLQAFHGADDDFEWFGGAMDQKYLLGVDGSDDGYDTQLGTRNRAQFVIIRVTPQKSPNGGQFGERGMEADNNEFGFDEVQCAGRSNITLANGTFIGDKRAGPNFPGSTQGAQFRRGTGYTLLNSIIANFKSIGIAVSDSSTWSAHCAANPAGPALFCPGALGVADPLATGNVFVARSLPNPFHTRVSFSFTLPQSGPVSVEIYSADGRHVQTLANGVMEAGQHSLTWNLEKETPSGVYFYRVMAGNNSSTGKITRVD